MLVCALAIARSVAFAAVADPPDRVARLSYILGEASVQSAGARRADSATINWPVTSGDRVRTQAASGAELDLGAARLRLDQQTDLTLTKFDSSAGQIRVDGGAVSVELRESPPQPLRIQVAHAAIALDQPGEYRVDAHDGTAEIVVRAGAAEISAGPARFQQSPNEALRIAADGTVALEAAPARDEFDRWSERRTQLTGGERTALHVAKGLVGYEDLDSYGVWQWVRDYGMVWEPRRVSRDWAPYRFGQWIWKQPWGWTWVDDAPWGFAPFHTGRWLQTDTQRWLWVPGPRQLPPVYAPALVGWSGEPDEHSRPQWVPLGPGEQYIPPYPASDAYIRRLNMFATVASQDSRRLSVSTDLDARSSR
jgi:hypothetical protein